MSVSGHFAISCQATTTLFGFHFPGSSLSGRYAYSPDPNTKIQKFCSLFFPVSARLNRYGDPHHIRTSSEMLMVFPLSAQQTETLQKEITITLNRSDMNWHPFNIDGINCTRFTTQLAQDAKLPIPVMGMPFQLLQWTRSQHGKTPHPERFIFTPSQVQANWNNLGKVFGRELT